MSFHQHRRRLRFLLLVLLCEAALFATMRSADILVAPPPPLHAPAVREGKISLARLTFESGLPDWEEKVFKGKPVYRVEGDEPARILDARSDDSCSGLFRRVQVPVTPDLFVEWTWRVGAFPKKREPDKLANRREDDFAARVYLIFPASNFFKSEVIEYIWDESIPAGTLEESAYSDRIKLFVIRTGAPPGEGLEAERRNVYEDYRRFFGKEPKRPLGIVAVMSDSDNTGSSSEARFGPVDLFQKPLTHVSKEVRSHEP